MVDGGMSSTMQDPTALASPFLDGLARHGPTGAIIAVGMSMALYIVKRLFDRVLDAADQTKQTHSVKLDSIDRGIDDMKNAMVDELREMRHSIELSLQAISGRVDAALGNGDTSGVRRDPTLPPVRRPTRGGGGRGNPPAGGM
jgi:hypothetical protein